MCSEPDHTETRVGLVYNDPDVYVGRGRGGNHMLNTPVGDRGWLGNPFPADEYGRETCIRLFRDAFETLVAHHPQFRNEVRRLSGATLGCWCRTVDSDEPACHGDVIADMADALARGDGAVEADRTGGWVAVVDDDARLVWHRSVEYDGRVHGCRCGLDAREWAAWTRLGHLATSLTRDVAVADPDAVDICAECDDRPWSDAIDGGVP
jgi:hypothetical protein